MGKSKLISEIQERRGGRFHHGLVHCARETEQNDQQYLQHLTRTDPGQLTSSRHPAFVGRGMDALLHINAGGGGFVWACIPSPCLSLFGGSPVGVAGLRGFGRPLVSRGRADRFFYSVGARSQDRTAALRNWRRHRPRTEGIEWAKIPQHLRETIARNIRQCRLDTFPGRGGGKQCAEKLGVSPQQWSPWERGLRTPDEMRLAQIAEFFGTTVEWLRTDHRNVNPNNPEQSKPSPSLPPGAPPLSCSINYHLLCQIMNHATQIQSLCGRVLTEGAKRTEQLLSSGMGDGFNVTKRGDPAEQDKALSLGE